jgi:hypothetical protein
MAKTSDKEIVSSVLDKQLDPNILQSIQSLRSGKVPGSAIKTRQAPGGKELKYVAHTWGTRQLQQALPEFWSWEVLGWEVFDHDISLKGRDGSSQKKQQISVAVHGRLTIHIPMQASANGTPNFHNVTIAEVAAFIPPKSMPHASAVASAASRCLMRCMMRRFGIGLEFYESDDTADEITPKTAWNLLITYLTNQGIYNEDVRVQLVDRLKEADIKRESLVERFQDAYQICYEIAHPPINENMPEDL